MYPTSAAGPPKPMRPQLEEVQDEIPHVATGAGSADDRSSKTTRVAAPSAAARS